MFERILVPTDGSDPAERAIPKAVKLADIHDGTIHAIYVAEPVPLSRFTAGMQSAGAEHKSVREEQQQEAEDAIATIRETAGKQDVPVVDAIKYGNPSEKIIEYAKEANIDVIVMGTHGRSGADRLIIGSVAEKVVRQSPIPVLTVRE